MIWRGYILLILMLVSFSLFGEEYDRDRGGIRSQHVSLAPVLGRLLRPAKSGQSIRNEFIAGLALNAPLSSAFAFELQGTYGLDSVQFGGVATYLANEYALGATLKLGFNVGPVRPYLGAGGQFVIYDKVFKYSATPSTWLGLAHAMVGMDFELSRGLVLGVRATGNAPVLNRSGSNAFNAPSFSPSFTLNPVDDLSLLLSVQLWLVL